jgi:2-phospho-L-lactate guanylyltransferase (CobY/MobA/RfbA family)
VMRLPADLPLIEARDVDELISTELRAPAALLVPSHEGTGTNTIIRMPPDLFPSRFGPNSLRLHKQEAARVGVVCLVVSNERIALDIDEPSDLKVLLRLGMSTKTYSIVESLGIEERLGVS